MFKARRKGTDTIVEVLSVYTDPAIDATYFFIWENDGWRWRPASSFVPPKYDKDKLDTTQKV